MWQTGRYEEAIRVAMSPGLQLARNKWHFSRVMEKRWHNVDRFCYKNKVNASLNSEVIVDRGEQRDTELLLAP